MNVAAVIPAAGRGRRLGGKIPKAFVPIAGKPLFIHTLEKLSGSFRFREIIVAAHPSESSKTRKILNRHGFGAVSVVDGGRTRAESVRNALRAVALSDWVLVHDAARPFVSAATIRATVAAARSTGGAICVHPVSSTVKRILKKLVSGTLDRRELFLAQTPQVFRKDLLVARYRSLGRKAFMKTDEAALFDGSRTQIRAVAGNSENIKITTPQDLALFKFYAGKRRP